MRSHATHGTKFGRFTLGLLLWLPPLMFFPLRTARLAASGSLGDGFQSSVAVSMHSAAILALFSLLVSFVDRIIGFPRWLMFLFILVQFLLLLYFICVHGVSELDDPQDSAGRGKISVVLPCLNETYAVETVRSFCQRTPRYALEEILVVDDGSQPPVAQRLSNAGIDDRCNVRILRHEKPGGLMIAKQTGGDAAVGKFIGFFDCHVAPNVGWHKEIIDLLEAKPRRLVVPQIGDIDVDSWDMVKDPNMVWKSKCYIDLNADFWWYDDDSPFIPVISGGLVATSRQWWLESGGFDHGMNGWGGENSDQSLRSWLCGGDVIRATTSQIAHMWRVGNDERTLSKYSWQGRQTDNLARVAAAWFGEFAGAFRSGNVDSKIDVSETFERKRRLGCKPFVYYLHRFRKVYRDGAVLAKDVFHIRARHTNLCITQQGTIGFRLTHCKDSTPTWFHLANLKPDGFPSEEALKLAVPTKTLRSRPVTCGQHQAASCSECSQGHGEAWCHADCTWAFGSCVPKPPAVKQKAECCSGIRAYRSLYCLDALRKDGPIPYQCNVLGDNLNQQYIFQSDGLIRHSSGFCLGVAPVGVALAPMDCSLNNVTRWDKVDGFQSPDLKLYEEGVKKYALSEDLPDH